MIQISREENHHVNVLVKLEPFSPIEFVVSAKIEVVKSPSINEGLSILPVAFRDYRLLKGGKITRRQIGGNEVEIVSGQVCDHWKNTL